MGYFKGLLKNILSKTKNDVRNPNQLQQKIKVLFKKVTNYYGKEKLMMKAGQFEALELMESNKIKESLTALERILFKDPTIPINGDNKSSRINKLEDKIAEIKAEKEVENSIEQEIKIRMKKRQQEYIQEIKKEIVSENEDQVNNASTFKKLAHLKKMESRSINSSNMNLIRPSNLDEIIGQDRALKAVVSKVASPYPQHVILYGPPGVGKTTAARLTLEKAKKLENTPFCKDSEFVEVDGSTLRWDPRESTNPLLGSVHDPIYQGAKQQLADGGVPEPKTGLVTEAHGGVLFIDEIGELDLMLQNKLLKVMEDKRVNFESSYYDENDDNIPQYIKKLFKDGAPADFILIGATTQSPQNISPAFRSRCTEVFFNPLTKKDIVQIINNAVKKLEVKVQPQIANIISKYTIEARSAINLLLDAYSLALYENDSDKNKTIVISEEILYQAIQNRRMTPNHQVDVSSGTEIGSIFGLGVNGFLGTQIEIETVAFEARRRGEGGLRFNETAGSMAKDSLFNAASVVRKITGKRMDDFDLHVNIVGGGNIDGPSAGLAMLLTIISAIEGIPLPQNIAVTGEVAIHGRVKPVGGLKEKIYAAEQASIEKVLIPERNKKDINKETEVELIPVATVQEALNIVLGYRKQMSAMLR